MIVAFGIMAFVVQLATAAPPPIPPILRIELTVDHGKGPKSLSIYDGEYLRVDFLEAPNEPVTQVWWSRDDWNSFSKSLSSKKIATRGKVTLKASSPEGTLVVGEIEKRVLGPAAAKTAREAAERFLQDQLRRKDNK